MVFLLLLAIFIIIPLLELWLILAVGSEVGYLPTILTLLIISVTGAALAKQQGYRAVVRIRQDVNEGRMPADSLLEGVLVLAGALLLLTPGFITDVMGLSVLVPPSRRLVRRWVKKRLQRSVMRRTLAFWPPGGRGRHDPGNPGSAGPPRPEQRRKELEG